MFSFIFRMLLLASVMFAMTVPVAANPLATSLTHHRNGMGVGSAFNNTLLALTASATTDLDIPLGTWRAGDSFTPLSNPAALGNAGIGAFTFSTAATFAPRTGETAEVVSLTAKIRVSNNYGNTPQLIGWFSSSATDVSLSITATIFLNTEGSAMDDTGLADTAVFIPTASTDALTEVVLHDALAPNPNQELVILLERTGGTTAILYLHRLFLRFRPFYVIP